MRRVNRRPFWRRVVRGDRGAAGTLFGVLMAAGVVMGMLALSVDVGNAMWERRQLQNGADATAMALARACANGEDGACVPDNFADLLDDNAADDEAGYNTDRADAPNGACARAAAGLNLPLEVCSSASDDANVGNLRECPPLPTWLAEAPEISYVETYSRTVTDGETILPGFFSNLFSAGDGPEGWLSACARAAWGPAGSYSASIPLTISACEWQRQVAVGWVEDQPVAPKPGYGGGDPQPEWPGVAKEVVITLHDPGDDEQGCDWNGKDTAGGFGWVDSDNCKAMVSTFGWVKIDTGNNVPNAGTPSCKDILPGLVGTTVSIPVFKCLIASHDDPAIKLEEMDPQPDCNPETRDSGGANAWYYIEGWARFYVSGYSFSGAVKDSIMPGGHTSCTDAAGDGSRCLYGWFLNGELDAEAIDTSGEGTDFGTYTVIPAG